MSSSGGARGGGSDAMLIADGGTIELNDDVTEGTLTAYRVKSATTFSAAAGSVELDPGAYTFERTDDDWYIYAAEGAALSELGAPPGVNEIEDDFNASNGNINGRNTPVGAKTWVTPWAAGLGSNALAISGNRLADTGGSGAARVLPSSADYRVSATYDVTGGSAQVRLFARADATDAQADGTSSVVAVIRANGNVDVDKGNDYSIGTIASGQPTSGIITLEVNGTSGKVLINGVQVGATFSVAGVVGTYAGIGLYSGGRADDFGVDYL